jgi:glycosyltransferase involved in cell wall biosynthesis
VSEKILRPRVFMMDLWATVPYYTAYLSRALLNEPIDLTVGSISYYLDSACFSSRGIKLHPGLLDIVGKFRLPRLPRRILKLLESIVNLAALSVRFLISPPDIVHVQYLPMLLARIPLDLWLVQLCRKRGSKIVLTVHDLLPHDTGQEFKKTYIDLYPIVDKLICHSDNIKARLTAEFFVPQEKISVIAHGPFFYDLPATASDQTLRSFGIEPGKLLVLWQGIIFPYKGIDLLLDAWQQVERSNSEICLLIVGTGPTEMLDQIREQISRLKLNNVKLHLHFISTEELVALYRAADIVVYPYRDITTSGALATGLALGKTIVASNLPVFGELLTNQKNALIIDPQNKAAFAEALLLLAGDSSLRQRLAANVQAMNFGDQSWQIIADKTTNCYRNILNPLV